MSAPQADAAAAGTALALALADPAATDALGAALARTQPAAAVVHLRGDLGAGKSSLARAWLRALGVSGTIRSPTYTLVERYPLDADDHASDARPTEMPAEALHLDLYRIGDPGELEFLGVDDAERALWLVEWPERGAQALPQVDLEIGLSWAGEGRAARLAARSPSGQAWLQRLAVVLAAVPELRSHAEP